MAVEYVNWKQSDIEAKGYTLIRVMEIEGEHNIVGPAILQRVAAERGVPIESICSFRHAPGQWGIYQRPLMDTDTAITLLKTMGRQLGYDQGGDKITEAAIVLEKALKEKRGG